MAQVINGDVQTNICKKRKAILGPAGHPFSAWQAGKNTKEHALLSYGGHLRRTTHGRSFARLQ